MSFDWAGLVNRVRLQHHLPRARFVHELRGGLPFVGLDLEVSPQPAGGPPTWLPTVRHPVPVAITEPCALVELWRILIAALSHEAGESFTVTAIDGRRWRPFDPHGGGR